MHSQTPIDSGSFAEPRLKIFFSKHIWAHNDFVGKCGAGLNLASSSIIALPAVWVGVEHQLIWFYILIRQLLITSASSLTSPARGFPFTSFGVFRTSVLAFVWPRVRLPPVRLPSTVCPSLGSRAPTASRLHRD